VRLWFANHLPIHAVMFARRLVSAAAPFDEQLAVYEDWDFWHRLARGHTFLHVPGVSATYRLLGQSGLTRERDEALSRNARRAIYLKWLPSLDADTLDRLATAGELARGKAREAVAAGEAAIAGRARDVAALEVRLAEYRAKEALLAQQLKDLAIELARQATEAAHAANAQAAALAQVQARAESTRKPFVPTPRPN
jgi:hypothetical protein